MSLNHFTSNCKTAGGNDATYKSFNIGAKTICTDELESKAILTEEIKTSTLTIINDDTTETVFEHPNQGNSGEVLHTDGIGGTYWAPDIGTSGGIVYNGTTPATVGAHLITNSTDGLTAKESKLSETATELDLGTLKGINAAEPTDPQDLATKNYVDTKAVDECFKYQFSTGVISGGEITDNVDTTKFDVSAGTGIIVDPVADTKTDVAWGAFTAEAILGGQIYTYVSISSTGTIIKSATLPTNTDLRNQIYLGLLNTPDTVNVQSIDNHAHTVLNTNNSLQDLIRVLGHISTEGNIISKSALSLLGIEKSEGVVFTYGANFHNDIKNPHNLTLPFTNSDTGEMRYYMSNGDVSSALTTINPNYYDTGTNYPSTLVPSNEWTVQRVYSSAAVSNALHIQLGQATFVKKQDAINDITSGTFLVNQNVADNDVLLAYIVIQQGTTDLTNAQFIQAAQLGQTSGGVPAPYTNLSEGTTTTTTVDVNSSTGTNATLLQASSIRAGVLSSAKFDEIVANTAKVSNVSTNLSEGTTTTTTVDVNSSDGTNATLLQASSIRAGVLSSAKFDEIVANTAKVSNVSTNLSEGTTTTTTVDVNSSDGTNATLLQASSIRAGVLSSAKFDEIVANTAKVSNVSTNLSEGTRTTTTVDVNSSDGTNATLNEATGSLAGVLSSTKFNEIVANTAKVSNATHTGDAVGDTVLTAQPALITGKTAGTVASGDLVLIADIDDSNNLKQVSAQSIADLGSGATNLSEGTTTTTTVDVDSSTGTNATLLQASSIRAGVLSSAKFDEIVANTAKVSNVSTNLSEGTTTTTTVDVNSSDGTNATLLQASSIRAGVLSSAKFDEIVANTAKVSNVSTNLSEGTRTTTTVDVNSSDGTNATLSAATTSLAGVMTSSDKTKLDGIASGAQPKPELTKSIYLFDPIATDDIPIWQVGVAITITKVVHQISGSTNVSFNLNHSGGTDLWAADKTATTTKTSETTFTDATCTADNYISYQASAITGTPTSIAITITYTED